MNDREVFEAWAPSDVPWSAWAKPTLLAGKTSVPAASVAATAPPAIAPPAARDGGGPRISDAMWAESLPAHSALVLELPGVVSIETGIALRPKGYWPVPLFNATCGPNACVDVAPMLRALRAGAAMLGGAGNAESSLPCFLLDSGRCPPGVRGTPGRYDNRSVVFPQDFPSATLLRSRGIEQAIVVTVGADSSGFAPDIAHVLYGWQRDGLRILRFAPASQKPPQAVDVRKPGGFGMFWRRIVTMAGLRRSGSGGFGTLVPEASTGSGYS